MRHVEVADMRRKLTAALSGLVLVVALFAQATPAAAELEWCSGDPIINVNGTIYSVTSTMSTGAQNVRLVAYEVIYPRGGTASLVAETSNLPSNVTFTPGGDDDSISFRVTVKSKLTFAVTVDVALGDARFTTPTVLTTRGGVSNQTIRLRIPIDERSGQ